MHKITFYPLGNADSCLIDLANGSKLLFDYAHTKDSEDDDDKRIDLKSEILNNLEDADKDYFDVVAFTHADNDHLRGFSDIFYLQHAEKYQDDDRIKIDDLWVPAALIIEKNLEGEAKILRAEARHRLKEGKNIRVFSRPERLEDWLKEQGLKLKDREKLITNAGQMVPGYKKSNAGIEFFVHSPFSITEDEEIIDRNESSMVLQATFRSGELDTRLILSADTVYETWIDIVNITKAKKRESRLEWDIMKIPHHCSYLSLSDDKGKEITVPVKEVKWLFEQGKNAGILVSSSNPIPSNDDNDQPPHRQAANYYKKVSKKIEGNFIVTMEHPKQSDPEPLIITIDDFGATLKKSITSATAIVTSKKSPRFGYSN